MVDSVEGPLLYNLALTLKTTGHRTGLWDAVTGKDLFLYKGSGACFSKKYGIPGKESLWRSN